MLCFSEISGYTEALNFDTIKKVNYHTYIIIYNNTLSVLIINKCLGFIDIFKK